MDSKILNDALYSTYTKFSETAHGKNTQRGLEQIIAALIIYLKSNDTKHFSRANMGRENIEKYIKREELAEYLAEYFVKMSKIKQPETSDELTLSLQMLGMSPKEAVEQLKNCMLGKETKLKNVDASSIARTVCSRYSKIEMNQRDEAEKAVVKKVEASVDPKYGVKNLEVNTGLVNYCREEVLNGRQIAIQNELKEKNLAARARREYNLNDEMTAVTDIGIRRDKQQDSVVMLYHPQNPKYKLLVVADGMGGTVDGDKASQEITKQMTLWFESLNPDMMLDQNAKILQEEWKKKLNEIHSEVLRTTPDSGSTFVGAIVGENTTTIAGIGDSRCYVLDKNNHLQQMTVDDNVDFVTFHTKWEQIAKAQKGRLDKEQYKLRSQEKENLRFKRTNNQITKCIGARIFKPVEPRFASIKNDSYQSLMLFSDGVTDCLSDDQLYAITRRTSSKKLAGRIVDEALRNYSVRNEFKDNPNYTSRIDAGKDNTSAVVFDKRKDEGGER